MVWVAMALASFGSPPIDRTCAHLKAANGSRSSGADKKCIADHIGLNIWESKGGSMSCLGYHSKKSSMATVPFNGTQTLAERSLRCIQLPRTSKSIAQHGWDSKWTESRAS